MTYNSQNKSLEDKNCPKYTFWHTSSETRPYQRGWFKTLKIAKIFQKRFEIRENWHISNKGWGAEKEENDSKKLDWPWLDSSELQDCKVPPWKLHKIFWNLFGLNAIFDIMRENNDKQNCSIQGLYYWYITNKFVFNRFGWKSFSKRHHRFAAKATAF